MLAAFAYAAAVPALRGAGTATLPAPRRRRLLSLFPALVGTAAVLPTISLPLISDDWALWSGRGKATDLLSAVRPDPDLMFFRPVGWAAWAVFGNLDLPVATIRGVAIGLFAWNIALVPPVLRRMGFPRGAAFFAALFFATHPISLETVAWLANFYSLFSLGLGLTALAILPVNGRETGRVAGCFIFASLSFLSKEEGLIWIPAAAICIITRFQLSRLRLVPRAIAPIFVAFAIVLAVRFLVLGGMGGYRETGTGRALPLDRYIEGFRGAIHSEFPSQLWLPLRSFESVLPRWIVMIPAALIVWLWALGFRRPGFRRALQLWWGMTICMLVPVAALVPIGPELAGARLLYSYSVVASLLPAVAVQSLPRRPALAFCSLWIALSVSAQQYNFQAWRESAAAMEHGLGLAVQAVREFITPASQRVAVVGLPDSIHGVVCFRNAATGAIQSAVSRRGLMVSMPPGDLERFQQVIFIDMKNNRSAMLPDSEILVDLAAGDAVEFKFTDGAVMPFGIRPFNITTRQGPDRIDLAAPYFGGGLLLPTLNLVRGTKFKLTIDGETTPAGGAEPFFVVTRRDEVVLLRSRHAPGEWVDPGPVVRVSVEFHVPPGIRYALRSLKVTAG